MQFCHHRQGLLLVVQFVTISLLAATALTGRSAPKPAIPKAQPLDPEIYWSDRVEPLLDRRCLKCHAGVRQRGGLDLRSLETILRGGDSGPAIVPGRPNESRLVQYVLPGANPHMPLDATKQLTPAEIGIFKTWVALLPVSKSKPPTGAAANGAWTAEYLAQYRQSRPPREVAPAGLSPSAAIDWFLKTDWKRDNIVPAHPCDDAAFARRVYLDLAGRIPTPEEMKLFQGDVRPDRRGRLVAQLLAADDYARHMRELFDTALMGRPAGNNARARADSGWNAFLEESFRANRPWNEMVRDMIVARPADGTNGARRGAVWFLAERNNSYQAIAEAVAPVVFGVQINCAQCHNHPLSWEIEQRHYWGLVAVFNRSKNVDTETGAGVAESAIGGFINFANLKKESQPATLVFLNGKSVAERIPPADEKEVDSPALYVVPPAKEGQKPHSAAVPKFSRREAFADAVTQNNPALARAFVNRMWGALMGRGIVQPVDQIDSRHRPSHPELLDWLTADFERSGYDVKRLVRAITLSQAYQLASTPAGKTAPRPESFARALEKPLSAEQLLHSLWIATGNKPAAGQPATEQERAFTAAFPEVMPDTYSPSLQQALFLTNSPLVDDMLKPNPGSTTAKLLALKSDEARVHTAFQLILGRAPDSAERQQCEAILHAQSPAKGVRELLWALLTCAEFQVNH